MNIRQYLEAKVREALVAAGAPTGSPGVVRPSSRANFGDYQANGVMPVAKKLGMNPREFAELVLAKLDLDEVVDKLEIAGPGFINMFLKPEWMADQLITAQQDERANIQPVSKPQTIVVDLSAPNLAKEMHVGHLRSTIIGDAVARTLEFLGHKVIRQNHVGDWGTQFGMLIAYMEKLTSENPDALSMELSDLENFYREAKKLFDESPEFADQSREYVVKLQAGDEHCKNLWQRFIDISLSHSEEVYERLNVSLTRNDVMAESAYNDDLPNIVNILSDKGLLKEDQGAKVVFLDQFKTKDGDPMGVIIQKKDGGYLYATTDLAATRHRSRTLHADRVLYYVDARQSQHFQQVFTISRLAGFVNENCSFEHHPFGMMLGEDGRPFKTREGGVVKLAELLDEAEERAAVVLADKGTNLDEEQKVKVIRAVAMGAVKYADLSKNRTSDYVFSWDNMLALDGNTAPYLLYAYTRIQSIFRKANADPQTLEGSIQVVEPTERQLAIQLLRLHETIETVALDGTPHLLCSYLYELSGAFMSFYEKCPVNKEGVPEEIKNSRLLLCALVAKTLKIGLDVLGIETVDQM
ncbi:arginine--tRNA ligase [Endozoicomonas sp. SM1973]|uniref:Arginine--tRNA ligase n=1 Tax=Spartinivicinus marinus TaxID=2994442 RepID=A0A853I9W3_9GAMM|nr:arginine--tRNA ligase [Spartinivicinus marinus]MCX4026482.1 arginine--tRNA ligase [Spartinivicinus marinus]NYZ66854.1 arginine--tRNA ligase [Spartinivicinus marinus]